jgi:PHP family Zn ribbon phosphoesterase
VLLERGCNLSSDGRPIIGLSSKELLELLLGIDKKIILIPCHAWTPHFGIFGSASGFDSLEEAFGELSHYVYGIETGISSDPWMNWQIE